MRLPAISIGVLGVLGLSAWAQVDRNSIVTTVAGNFASSGPLGDGGSATSAVLLEPDGIALDRDGNLFIADVGHNRVRRVTPQGIISTVAGSGGRGFYGDGGPATQASMVDPTRVAVDSQGNLYIIDSGNSRIRRVTRDGVISTFAGGGSTSIQRLAPPVSALSAQFEVIYDITFDKDGENLYVLTSLYNPNAILSPSPRILRVGRQGTILSVVTPQGPPGAYGFLLAMGYSSAGAEWPWLAVAPDGSIYISNSTISGAEIWKMGSDGRGSRYVGSGYSGFFGDGGTALAAQLDQPSGLALDRDNNLYIADSDNHRIRRVTPQGVISTIAGMGRDAGDGRSGVAAGSALVYWPRCLAFDSTGNLYYSQWDYFYGDHPGIVRRISASPVPTPQISTGGVVSAASYQGSAIAPGEIIAIFGTDLGPASLTTLQLTPDGLVTTLLSETRVLVDGMPGPLIYVSQRQHSAIVPYGVATKSSVQVQVEYRGVKSTPTTVQLAPSMPGIFTLDASGRGQGAILNQDGRVNSPANPADRGSIIVLYGTGEGQTNPSGVDGKVATDVFPKPLLPVSVRIGGTPAEILYAGAAPGLVAGVLQVNARIPAELGTTGAVPISLTVGTATSPSGVTVSIR
jgi:uncharacterized protein (TIGR03437 family)